MEACKAIGLLSGIDSQNEFEECPFAFFKLLFSLLFVEAWIHSNIVLAFIGTDVRNFECPIIFASRFEFTLNAHHPLTGDVDCECAEVGGDPFSTCLFCDDCYCSRARKEVGFIFTCIPGSSQSTEQNSMAYNAGSFPHQCKWD